MTISFPYFAAMPSSSSPLSRPICSAPEPCRQWRAFAPANSQTGAQLVGCMLSESSTRKDGEVKYQSLDDVLEIARRRSRWKSAVLRDEGDASHVAFEGPATSSLNRPPCTTNCYQSTTLPHTQLPHSCQTDGAHSHTLLPAMSQVEALYIFDEHK